MEPAPSRKSSYPSISEAQFGDMGDFGDSSSSKDEDFPSVSRKVSQSRGVKVHHLSDDEMDAYAETVLSNVQKSIKEEAKWKRSGFYKYLTKKLKMTSIGNEIDISNVSLENVIHNMDFTISTCLKLIKVELEKIILGITKENIEAGRIRVISDVEISERMKEVLSRLSGLLGGYKYEFVGIGLGYYSHKFFHLAFDSCKPLETDTLEVWIEKNKVFKVYMRCYTNLFDTADFSIYKALVLEKSESSLISYFELSCFHLIELYKARSGMRMALAQKGYIGSNTLKSYEEFTNHFLNDYPHLKLKANKQNQIEKIKAQSDEKRKSFDKEIESQGAAATVLGKDAARIGRQMAVSGAGYLSGAIGQAGNYLSSYYNREEAASDNGNAQAVSENTETPKKGWFW